MAELNEQTITRAVLDRLSDCNDPRFKEVMTSLITHLHDFVREVKLTEEEWINALMFLTDTGKACTEKRQEFILLSDTLGVSMLVIALNHPPEKGSVESTVLGPYYWEGAPELPCGSNLAEGVVGERTLYSGRVLDVEGRPLPGALLDIWSGDGEGNYDMQMGEDVGMRARGKIRTDEQGRYWFWSIKPKFYPVPTDGPVGRMLRRMGRHPYRPGHIHLIISAPGHESVTTHLFPADSEYLYSDAVFGMRESLIAHYERHEPGRAPTGEHIETPYYTVEYDFRLRKAKPAAAA